MGDFQFQDLIIYHYILSDNLLLEQTKAEYFQNSVIRGLFTIAKEHGVKYHSAPSKQEVKNIIQLKCLGDELSDDIVETVYNNCSLSEYSEDWLRDNASKWIKIRNLEYVMRKATAYMKTSDLNASSANQVIENIRSMFISETAIDFDFKEGSDFFNAEAHSQAELVKHSTGYPYMDTVLNGGFYLGGLFVLLAGSKCGKSFWLCNLAAESIKMGNNTIYITLELPEGMVNKRIGANLMNISQDEYARKVKQKDVDFFKQRLTDLKTNSMIPMGELHVKQFPTSTLSAQALAIYIKKLEEKKGIKYKNVIIDYINIMQNAKNPNSENTYLKIKTIAEDLRAVGSENNWTMITVTQTTRDGWDTTDLQLKDISESAGLLHTVDGLFGVITNPEMKANGEYYLKAMAMRDGSQENTKKHFYINWEYGRISEDTIAKIEDCSMTNQLNAHNGRGRGRQGNNIQQPQQPTLQQQVAATTQMVYKNNQSFRKKAIEGMSFKCEYNTYENQGDNCNLTEGEKMFIVSTKDTNKMVAVRYTGLSHDSKPSFDILKFLNGNGDVPTCLNDIYVDNVAYISKFINGEMVTVGTSGYPMDIKELNMMEESKPMATDAFSNAKSGIDTNSMGLDLDLLSTNNLFETTIH